jgi:hypothetical protein
MKTFKDFQLDLGGRSGVEVQTTWRKADACPLTRLKALVLPSLRLARHVEGRGGIAITTAQADHSASL